MTSPRWKESLKLFRSHMDPEKDEQLKWITIGNSLSPKQPQCLQYNWRLWDSTIETKRMQFNAPPPAQSYLDLRFLRYAEHQRLRQTDTKVKRILKLIKSINYGNKEASLKKKSEIIQLLEEFHTQYQSLYALYNDLKEGVREKIKVEEDDNSSSSSSSSASLESDSYYSPDESGSTHSKSRTPRFQKVTNEISQKFGTSDVEDTSEVVKEALNVQPVSSSSKDEDVEVDEEADSRTEKLMSEAGFFGEKLEEREKELFSLTKAHQIFEIETSAKIKELDDQVTTLKLELETFNRQKREYEGQIECRANEVSKTGEENLRLRSQISELESTFKEKEDEISTVLEKFNQNENLLMAKLNNFMDKVKNLQMEVDSLRSQEGKVRERLLSETNNGLAQVNGLKQEIESLKSQKTASEMQLEKKTQEMSDFLVLVDSLRENLERKTLSEKGAVEEREGLKMQVKGLEMEMDSLRDQKRGLEEAFISLTHEANQSKLEKEQLHARVFQLEGKLAEKENEISTLQNKIEAIDIENDMSNQFSSLKSQINNLQQKCDCLTSEKREMETQLEREKTQMEEKNSVLINKISEQEKKLEEREDVMNKLNQEHKLVQVQFSDTKSSFRIAERKMEEMAEEFRKKFEDNLRLLSRRIRVAEQLHAENKEWYKKTIDKCEQEQKENEAAFEQFKTMSGIASETLAKSETMALNFAECCEHFMNRISKASCELNFAKDWVKRKNGVIKQVKEDFDCLLEQLDVKEGEILGSRQKVWKLENKVRELEKTVTEREEGVLVLKEEKREAIRQLCVWIDYHRGRSDYLKKLLSDLKARSQVRSPS